MENPIKGKRALVTGASSGLGVDFARRLAWYGCSLVLVARREERLREVQSQIQAEHGVPVEIIVMDLGETGAPEALFQQTEGAGRPVDVLVNNAGFGLYGQHASIPWKREKEMLELDIVVLAELTKRFLQPMLARNFGYILEVSSIGAFQPSPTYASYSAAKSFVLNLAEALNYELRKTGVGVTAVAPGITATEFLKVAGQRASLYQRIAMMKSPEVARIGIDAMLKRRPAVVPGLFNAVTAWSMRLIPRRIAAALSEIVMEAGQ